jgi:catechol 2,3-dioxygenase-like lactoylglutathione lyase family enzyme
MLLTNGFNHVATVTADLDRIVSFYRRVFGAEIIREIAPGDDHRRMAILDLGAGSALAISEQPANTIIGDRTRSGSRGPIDHYGVGVASRDTLEAVRDRLKAAGADIGEVQRLGNNWSVFFRDPDGMELEVCAPV